MSVERNIAFGLEMKRVPRPEIRRRVQEALEMVHLSGLGHRRPSQLSGGQQQRVALARALVNRPSVLLLDEPLGALDLKMRKEMQLELKKLQQQVGITFVYVTHDQGEALTMSNRIAVMHQGRVLQIGTPTEIYERPNCRFVADFIGESNFLEGRVVERDVEYVAVLVGEKLLVRATAGPDSLLARRGLLGELLPGRPVTVAVRPEKIRLLREAPPMLFNAFPGRVEEAIYVGTETHFRIRLEEGSLLMVRQQNIVSSAESSAYYGGQDPVWVAWPPESTLLLLD
jgi:spermidine/putrescine transport system ATP-binding protein